MKRDTTRDGSVATSSSQIQNTRQPDLFADWDANPLAPSKATRRQALAESIPKASARRNQAIEILSASPDGLTRHELAERMSVPLQSICSVALWLVRNGHAYQRGQRATATGSNASVLHYRSGGMA